MHYYNLVKRPYIVTPHWFDDSVKCRRRQNVDQYLFPDPDVLRSGFSIESLDISPELRDETELEDRFRQISHPEVLQGRRRSAGTRREAVDNRFNAWKSFTQASVKDGEFPPQNDNVWDGRRLLLSPLLQMGRGRRRAVESELKEAGAKIVNPQAPDEDSFDALIVPHADGPHYKMVCQSVPTDPESHANVIIGRSQWRETRWHSCLALPCSGNGMCYQSSGSSLAHSATCWRYSRIPGEGNAYSFRLQVAIHSVEPIPENLIDKLCWTLPRIP